MAGVSELHVITADGETLTTTKLQVAVVHKKRHDNVVQMIRKRLLVAGSWGLLNFKESSYINAQGKMQPMFEMTRDGYAFIVGKLTGKLAAQHQIAYIKAFNAEASYIKMEPGYTTCWADMNVARA